jgi:GTP-binding protein
MEKELPKILIIGEMNAGKSVLFNRLIREKKAVTTEIAGTTRDWLGQNISLNGKGAELIDTAGFLETEDDDLEKIVKANWQNKLKEAAIFLIVADSKPGVTPRLKSIVNQIRILNKPIVLAINKVDNADLVEEKLRLFSELGIKNMVWISGLLGKNLDELRNILASLLPETKPQPSAKLKIGIIGRPNVGKSTLLNDLAGYERAIVNETSGTTRDELEARISEDITLVDTPGLKKPGRIKTIIDFFSSRRSIFMSQTADLLIFVLDVNDGIVQQDYKIAHLLVKSKKPFILVLNKIDLMDSKDLEKATAYIKYRLKFLGEFPIIRISASEKQNLNELKTMIEKMAARLIQLTRIS